MEESRRLSNGLTKCKGMARSVSNEISLNKCPKICFNLQTIKFFFQTLSLVYNICPLQVYAVYIGCLLLSVPPKNVCFVTGTVFVWWLCLIPVSEEYEYLFIWLNCWYICMTNLVKMTLALCNPYVNVHLLY